MLSSILFPFPQREPSLYLVPLPAREGEPDVKATGRGPDLRTEVVASVRRRLRNTHAEGYFQVVAVEWVDVDHPAECLLEHVTAGGLALGGVGDFSGEAEASVGQETEALIDCGGGRI